MYKGTKLSTNYKQYNLKELFLVENVIVFPVTTSTRISTTTICTACWHTVQTSMSIMNHDPSLIFITIANTRLLRRI